MEAFYLIDKPIGMTSFDVLRHLKKELGIKKMGHTGTLDPLASGLLLVAVGNYTKLIPYFEKDTKEYEFIVQLDGVTDSYDSETAVRYISDESKEKYKNQLTRNEIDNILLKNFTGEIQQIPPKYSALKIDGKKALDKVRSGDNFEMKKRAATISEIEVLDFTYPTLKLRAKVSAGTYIRSIAFDLGNIIGTGGYITYLRRTKVGNLDVSQSQQLELFNSKNTYSEENLFGRDKLIKVEENLIRRLNDGLVTNTKKFEKKPGEYFIRNNDIISHVICYEDGVIRPKRKI